jgi:hypothetical protein
MSKENKYTLLFSILLLATKAQSAEFELLPSVAVSEEFTDNVFETPANRVSDYITRTLPGITLSYKAPVLTGDLGYVFDYRHYAKNSQPDEITHALSAKGHLTAMENLLFLDVSNEYQRVSLDVTRNTSIESLFVNQSDRNVVTASPYFTLRPSGRIMLKPGYRFIDTRYIKSNGVDKTDHIAFLNMTFELTKKWSLTADYTFTRELAVIDNFSQNQSLGGFRYEYADKSFLFAQGGKTWIEYDSGQHFSNTLWNAGLSHVFDTVTATITTGVKYDEDPLRNIMQESFVIVSVEKRFQRGTLSLSPYYFDYVSTNSNTQPVNPINQYIAATKKYGATVRGQHAFTADLNSNLAFTLEKYEQQSSYTRRFQADSGLSYLVGKQLTASLTYIYTGYDSPGIATDNRHVNRAMIEIKKVF